MTEFVFCYCPSQSSFAAILLVVAFYDTKKYPENNLGLSLALPL